MTAKGTEKTLSFANNLACTETGRVGVNKLIKIQKFPSTKIITAIEK